MHTAEIVREAPTPTPVREWSDVTAASFAAEVATRYEPAVLRGVVADWPAVEAGRGTAEDMGRYLMGFDRSLPIKIFFAPPETGGRFFYRPGLDGFNFTVVDTRMASLLSTLAAVAAQQERQAIYLGATPIPQLFPGFEHANRLPVAGDKQAEPKIWIGNESIVAPHFDEYDNIACVASGRRRFTLYPPDQVANLYVGPLDTTMAGQPASMVDIHNPDFERFPRFRKAQEAALVADLEPGDAIFIPALWWHHVHARGDLNVLVNYWWNDSPTDAGSPLHCLAHGLLTISHLPEPKREAWRALIEHYVFKKNGEPAAHIPPAQRGILSDTSPAVRHRIRSFLLRALGHLHSGS
jgi:hypothetical protein